MGNFQIDFDDGFSYPILKQKIPNEREFNKELYTR